MDTTAPSLKGLTLPTTVDLSLGSKDVIFSAQAQDNAGGSGVNYIFLVLDNNLAFSWVTGNNLQIGSSGWSTDTFTDSTPAIASTTMTVKALTNPGVYNVSTVYVYDMAGNVASYTGSDLKALGFNTSFTVTGSTVDTTAPIVSNFSPLDAAIGVPVSSNVVLTFSEAIQKGTGTISIHSGSFVGTIVESYDVATSTNLTISGSQLTINPTSDLASGMHYFVTFEQGSIKDFAENRYSGTTAYSFTTAPVFTSQDISSPSTQLLFNGNIYEIVITSSGMSFDDAIQLSSSKILKGVSGHLATITSSQEQTAIWNKFQTGPFIALTDKVTEGTWVWAAGPEQGQITSFTAWGSGEPNNAGGNENYVVMAPWLGGKWNDQEAAGTYLVEYEGTMDTTAPTVSSFSPADAATVVAVGSDIVLTFSEAIQKGIGTIIIHSGSATGTVLESYDAATSNNLSVSGSTLTINPTADLANGTHYFVTFENGSIDDLAGNHYAGTAAYDFTTADISSPTVSTFSPADATTSVAVNSDVVLTFSEAIQKGTGTIAIHSGSATGTIVESYNAATSTHLSISGSTLTINPTADLVKGTHYFVTIDDGCIKDTAGNSYAGTTSYDFTTITDADHPLMSPVTHNGVNVDPERYSGPATAAGGEIIHFQFLGEIAKDVVIGTMYNDFISVGAGVDAVNSGAGNDVVDGGLDSNFLTGGAGTDIFFSDGRGGGTTWSTITDWQAGEQLSVWGWKPGISKIIMWREDGAEGYKGITMHADLDGNGVIDTSVTFTGISSQSQLPTPLDQFDNLLWFK